MNNKTPHPLPHLLGITYEDLETSMFQFLVVFRTYDYSSDEQKLKLFPYTLKDAASC